MIYLGKELLSIDDDGIDYIAKVGGVERYRKQKSSSNNENVNIRQELQSKVLYEYSKQELEKEIAKGNQDAIKRLEILNKNRS
jgi:hypothetical protein